MRPQTPTLPILDRREEIERAIREHQVVVICGQTGSGKTTQIPQICLAIGRGGGKQGGIIGHTQPRRLAARAVAARIAEERGEALGGIVGVKVRFNDQTSARTRIKVMTDGLLLAELGSDPELRAYDTLIIDEAHERSLNIDFLLGHLRRLLPRRADLKLIVTSATIDPGRFSDHFGGPDFAPVIEVSGRMFPVEVRYHGRDTTGEAEDRVDAEAVADAVEELLTRGGSGITSGEPGDVLVFLPGEREIRVAGDALSRRRLNAEVLPLFSRLSNQEQDRIFHPGPRPRIVLATNVAETSLTVPRIRFVVDTGLARINRYDPVRKIQRLPVEPISRASADQRSGRCGRIASGICIRLYDEAAHAARPAFTDPEIRRTSLASVILRLKSMGDRFGSIEQFPFLDPPAMEAVRDGHETLFELGAITSPDADGQITETGRRMGRMPLDPRVARMLIAAEHEGAVAETIVLAAALSIQDPRERPQARQEDADRAHSIFRHESSDFLTLLKVWDQFLHAASNQSRGGLTAWCRDHFLSPARMREWGEMIDQLYEVAEELDLRITTGGATADAVHRAVLTGLISNVACREGDGSFDYRGVRGNAVQIFPGSSLFKKGPKWIVAAEIVQTTRLYARTVARVEPEWIEELAGHMFRRQVTDQHLDAETGEPSAWERVSMSGIVVVPRRRTPLAPLDPVAAREVFIREGLVRGKWKGEADFMAHNREVFAQGARLEAKLRRRDVLASEDRLAEFFERALPREVADPGTLTRWLAHASDTDRARLKFSISDVADSVDVKLADGDRFPDSLTLPTSDERKTAPIEYAFAPGKEEDGVTLTVTLAQLAALSPERSDWLVPGMLGDLVQGLVKQLPKADRQRLEDAAGGPGSASGLAEVVQFGEGSLAAALSETTGALYGVKVPAASWSFKGLPAHLRLRVRVLDHSGKEIAQGRDVAELHTRLRGKIDRAAAAQQRSRFERHGLTGWDFDRPLLQPIEDEGVQGVSMLMDDGPNVRLTLAPSLEVAERETLRGVRRLFALASAEEVGYYLESLPNWSDMVRQFVALGTTPELRDQLTCLIAERTFMESQAEVRTRDAFEARKTEQWGRLSQAAREIGEIVGRVLEARARVAQRISGGTPRLWAESVADIREHAVYLMPRGFLGLVPLARLRRYPAYAESMRERLFSLREEGSRAETDSLKLFLPHWKRFTGWVAAAMSAERAKASDTGKDPEPDSPTRSKAPLPQTRRKGATVNLDAGEWAMQPGHLTDDIAAYRWSLEEYRLALFAPQMAAKPAISAAEIERLWLAATPETRDSGRGKPGRRA